MRLRTRSTRISPPPPGTEPRPASLNLAITSRIGILNTSAKWLNSGGLKAWMLMCGYFLADVVEQVEIPVNAEFRVVPALHEDLDTADGRQLVELLVDLLVRVRT